MGITINARVADIYHGDAVHDFAAAHAWGLRAVIHKATQGAWVADPLYTGRRKAALAAGLLWGAYHFNTGQPIAAQCKQFLSHAEPDAATLVALDFEDNSASNMSLAQALQFLETIDAAVGRPCALYTGNRLKETITHASADQRKVLGARKLWLCEYGPVPRMTDANGTPLPWGAPYLWQYTDGSVGPTPHGVPGLQPHLDLNHYAGTDEELAATWSK